MASDQSAAVGSAWPNALPANFTFNDYKVERVLGAGGFGIVYLACHVELDRRVAIKEYLPRDCAVRDGLAVRTIGAEYRAVFEDGLTRFRNEARRLVELDEHPAIVSCHDFFRANGTAYLVMEYVDGEPLSAVLRTREAAGRPFGQSDLLNVVVPLLEGLAQVHAAGVIHRDIKPGNIMIRKIDKQPILLDFGAAKQGVAELTKSGAGAPYTPGYAAFEQVGDGKLGPWTDIYAIGAVMWRMVAGGNPPSEPLRPLKAESRVLAKNSGVDDPLPPASVVGAGRFSARLLAVIEDCLRLQDDERTQDCGELLHILRGVGIIADTSEDVPPNNEEEAARCRNAADQGHPWAQYSLGKLFASGRGVPKSYEKAATWYRKAADQGHANAQYKLGDMYLLGDFVPEDREEAAAWYRRAADQGHADAQWSLGILSEDYEEAATWYHKAADQGHPSAQESIGDLYAEGIGVPESHEEAAAWYRKAADQGHPSAQQSLGDMYSNGRGVPQDDGEAARWYRKAADQGCAGAQNCLGQMYSNGRGVPHDDGEAVGWFRKAANRGSPNAQNNLGIMYATGRGVPKDEVAAAAWRRLAADQGHANAQYNLGEIYYWGRGVLEQDREEAAGWYRKAAGQGHPDAQYMLGFLFCNDQGVPEDQVQAWAWYSLAAERGHEDARRELDFLGDRMTPKQISKAQRLSHELMLERHQLSLFD